MAASQRVNVFGTWDGSQPLAGLALELPPEWTLERLLVIREGQQTPLALTVRRENGQFIAQAAEPLRGPLDLIAQFRPGAMTGFWPTAWTPLTASPRAAEVEPVLVPLSASRETVGLTVVPSARSKRNRALDLGRQGEPVVLSRRALPGLSARDPFTVEFWTKTTGLDQVLLSAWDGQETRPYPVEMVVDSRGRLVFYRGEPGRHESMRTVRPVADGQWHHVALTHDPKGGWTRLYLDAEAADSLRHRGDSPGSNTLPLAIGGRERAARTPAAPGFTGEVDELRIWPSARSAKAIRSTRMRQAEAKGLFYLGFDEPIPAQVLARPLNNDKGRQPSDLTFAYPVKALDAAVRGGMVQLSWETQDRTGKRYVIERSVNGSSFQAVGTVRPDENVAESAQGTRRYLFSDLPPSDEVLFYRIRQEFADGPARLSTAVKLGMGQTDQPLAAILGNSPNPFSTSTTITYEVTEAVPVRLSVWDVSGQQIATLIDQTVGEGRHTLDFEATGLPSGVYFVRLQTPSASATHKMTLVR